MTTLHSSESSPSGCDTLETLSEKLSNIKIKLAVSNNIKIIFLDQSFHSWQLHRDPRELSAETIPLHEIMSRQAERERNPELERAACILKEIHNFKHILVLGDVDHELISLLNNGNPLHPSISEKDDVQLYIVELNSILTMIKGNNDKLIHAAIQSKEPSRILFVGKKVSLNINEEPGFGRGSNALVGQYKQ